MKSFCKINLNLQVLNKRIDGYHNLSSFVLPLEYHDIVEVKDSNKSFINSKVVIENNIIMKVIELIKEKYKVEKNVEVLLNKRIPIGSGLGGGSSNAAYIINELNDRWELNLSDNDKIDISSKLGSDITFFLFNKPAVIEGKGDIIRFVNFNEKYYFLIIDTNIMVSTKKVFSLNNKFSRSSYSDKFDNYIDENYLINDLEEASFNAYPDLLIIKKKIENFINRKLFLTGTGGSFFLFSKSKNDLIKIKEILNYELKINSFLTYNLT